MRLICVSYQLSHTIPIINYLKTHDLRDCIFFGDSGLKNYVENNGFQFLSCQNREIENLLLYRKNKQIKKSSKVYKALHSEIKKIIDEYRIDEMFCDISRYMFYAPVCYINNIDVVLFWTYNTPTHLNLRAYPQNVFPIKESKYDCFIKWLRQIYIGEIKSKKIYMYFSYPYNIFLNPKYLFKIRYCIDGFYINTKKIICGPKEFSLFHDNNTLFDQIVLYDNRKIDERFEKILSMNRTKIYVSFGTNNDRYVNGVSVMKYIIQCLAKDKHMLVIVNLGKDSILLNEEYENIYYVHDINQEKLLEKMDVIIFHGGFGTLKECYYHKKKVIVVPFMYDQFANAKLVERLNMGITIKESEAFDVDFLKLVKKIIGENGSDE